MTDKKSALKAVVEDALEEKFGGRLKQLEELIQDSRNDTDVRSELRELEEVEIDRSKRMHDPRVINRANKCSRLLRCFMAAGGDVHKAADIAKDMGDETVVKALGTVDVSGGGALVPEDFSADLVDFLRNNTVVMERGARTLDMPSGQGTFPRVTQGAVATYRGESTNAGFSTPTLGESNPRAHILDVLGSMSNQLLRRSSVDADSFLREDLEAAARVKQDATFLRSDGSQNQPRGMLFLAETASKFAAANAATGPDGSTAAEIIADLATMVQLLKDNNIRMIRPGFICSNRIERKLMTLRDGDGWIFKEEMSANGTIFGIPYSATAQVPNNLNGSGGGDDSEVYLADFFDLVMYNTLGLNVAMSTEAAYNDGAGLKSSFQRDETVVRVSMEHDFVARRLGKEIIVLEDVRWGA